MQDWNGKMVPEIGYLFEKAYWHRGYASEAAKGCKEYAFQSLKLPRVYSIIREDVYKRQLWKLNTWRERSATVCSF